MMARSKRIALWGVVGVFAATGFFWCIPGERYSALDGAINGKHPILARLFVLAGADVNGRDYSIKITPFEPNHPVISAVRTGDTALLHFLISRGGDVNFHWGEGASPLYLAVLTKNVEIVRVLLKHGANPDLENVGFAEQPTDQSSPRKLAAKMKAQQIEDLFQAIPGHAMKPPAPS